jgi:cytochrome c biogenesis protein CcmG, thiol:disulfide interchange protein DsbE
MSARRQWLVVLAVVVVLGAGAVVATRVLRAELSAVAVGSRAPQFAAVTVDSVAPRTKTLADYAGHVVLLNVWATWCEPCRVEMPSMEALYKDFAAKGLRVVAVSVDQIAGPTEIRDYAKELGLTFDILHDTAQAIVRTYQVTGYPQSFVIGRDGTIRRKWIGADNWSSPSNRALMATLLASPGDAGR